MLHQEKNYAECLNGEMMVRYGNLQRLFLELKIMGYVKAGEVVVKVPLPEQMRDDLKSIAALDGISMKAWIAMCLNAKLATRSDELKELKAKRSKFKASITG